MVIYVRWCLETDEERERPLLNNLLNPIRSVSLVQSSLLIRSQWYASDILLNYYCNNFLLLISSSKSWLTLY